MKMPRVAPTGELIVLKRLFKLVLPVFAPAVLGAASPAAPAWLYPAEISSLPPVAVPTELPGSALHPSPDQLHDLAQAVDWYPADHPPAPDIVLHGHGAANACGYCHMINGVGRPENASIAGLDADYIRRAVRAYADGTRGSIVPDYLPHRLMRGTAQAVAPADLDAAARYFAALPRRSFGKVVETALIPAPAADSMAWRRDPSGRMVDLALRLFEMPDDFARFKVRDPRLTYTAYVPHGSLRRGEALAEGTIPGGPPACAACHGAAYQGTAIAPPLAGRSPHYLARALVNYRSHDRRGPDAAPMWQVTERLSNRDVIALAAWMGSRPVK